MGATALFWLPGSKVVRCELTEAVAGCWSVGIGEPENICLEASDDRKKKKETSSPHQTVNLKVPPVDVKSCRATLHLFPLNVSSCRWAIRAALIVQARNIILLPLCRLKKSTSVGMWPCPLTSQCREFTYPCLY